MKKKSKQSVPRNQYIPDWPNPRRSYSREAMNIARAMRRKLDQG